MGKVTHECLFPRILSSVTIPKRQAAQLLTAFLSHKNGLLVVAKKGNIFHDARGKKAKEHQQQKLMRVMEWM
jgi:hypothetical protein